MNSMNPHPRCTPRSGRWRKGCQRRQQAAGQVTCDRRRARKEVANKQAQMAKHAEDKQAAAGTHTQAKRNPLTPTPATLNPNQQRRALQGCGRKRPEQSRNPQPESEMQSSTRPRHHPMKRKMKDGLERQACKDSPSTHRNSNNPQARTDKHNQTPKPEPQRPSTREDDEDDLGSKACKGGRKHHWQVKRKQVRKTKPQAPNPHPEQSRNPQPESEMQSSTRPRHHPMKRKTKDGLERQACKDSPSTHRNSNNPQARTDKQNQTPEPEPQRPSIRIRGAERSKAAAGR